MNMSKIDQESPDIQEVSQPVNPIAEMAKVEDKVDSRFHEIKYLPSKFKLYPPGTKLYGRPLTTLEVKKLSTINDGNVDSILDTVVRSAIKGIDFDDMLSFDKLYLIFWLRENTYQNSGFTIDFFCSKCESESKYEFELNNVDVMEIRDDYDEDRILKLPVSGDEVKVRYLRNRDIKQMDNFLESNKQSMMDFDAEIIEEAKRIASINGNASTSLLTAYEYILDMDPADMAYLESYYKHIMCGVSSILNVNCKKCGGTAPVGVVFQREFFIPTYSFE